MPDDAGAAPPEPGRALQVLTILWAITAILMAAFGHTFLLGVPLLLCGFILGIAWLCLAVSRLILGRGVTRLDWGGLVAWALCLATGLLLGAACFSQWPLASEGIAYVREGISHARFSNHPVGRWWAFHCPD